MKGKINTEFIITILSLPKVGRKTAQRLLNTLDYTISDTKDLWDFIQEKKAAIKFPDVTAGDFSVASDKANSIVEKSEKQDVKVVSSLEDAFPSRLKETTDCPVLLYYKGDINTLNKKVNVAVIGTREPSELGERIGQRLGEVFAEYNFNVVSGLAIGCDAAGHKGALKGGGTTTAVMAHGLDKVYPKENKELALEILEKGGVLISEYPVGQGPIGNFFVERDRIQAGLSESVVVVETDVKGGTMHTAKYCMDYKRKLVCFNHPEQNRAHPKAQGNQKLIKENSAIPVYSKDEINTMIFTLMWDNFEPAEKQEVFTSLFNHIVPYHDAYITFKKHLNNLIQVHQEKEFKPYKHYKAIWETISSHINNEESYYKALLIAEGQTEGELIKKHLIKSNYDSNHSVYSWLDENFADYIKELPHSGSYKQSTTDKPKSSDNNPDTQLDLWV